MSAQTMNIDSIHTNPLAFIEDHKDFAVKVKLIDSEIELTHENLRTFACSTVAYFHNIPDIAKHVNIVNNLVRLSDKLIGDDGKQMREWLDMLIPHKNRAKLTDAEIDKLISEGKNPDLKLYGKKDKKKDYLPAHPVNNFLNNYPDWMVFKTPKTPVIKPDATVNAEMVKVLKKITKLGFNYAECITELDSLYLASISE